MLYFGSLLQVRQIIFLPFASVLVLLMLWWNNMAKSNLERSGFISLYTSRQHFMDRQEPMLCRKLEAGVDAEIMKECCLLSWSPQVAQPAFVFFLKINYCFSRPIKVSPPSLLPSQSPHSTTLPAPTHSSFFFRKRQVSRVYQSALVY